jgi:nitrogen fixation-related uncharacterized protein
MDAIFALVVVVVSLVALDLAALRWGSDTRSAVGDDRRRFS